MPVAAIGTSAKNGHGESSFSAFRYEGDVAVDGEVVADGGFEVLPARSEYEMLTVTRSGSRRAK
jgi:hypothetical protein